MRIFKEGKLKSTYQSLAFFREHLKFIGQVRYIILYYAEREWSINPDLYHQYVIIIGEKAQIWLSGLTWGYYGAGPSAFHDLMQTIDPDITYEQITSLEWLTDYPIMFENNNGKLALKAFNELARSMICAENNKLPWSIR